VWPKDQLITYWCRSANPIPFTAKIHYLQFQRSPHKTFDDDADADADDDDDDDDRIHSVTIFL